VEKFAGWPATILGGVKGHLEDAQTRVLYLERYLRPGVFFSFWVISRTVCIRDLGLTAAAEVGDMENEAVWNGKYSSYTTWDWSGTRSLAVRLDIEVVPVHRTDVEKCCWRTRDCAGVWEKFTGPSEVLPARFQKEELADANPAAV